MLPHKIRISVAPDGLITAETIGMVGPACLDQVQVLEELLDAVTETSTLTPDFDRVAPQTAEVENLDVRQR